MNDLTDAIVGEPNAVLDLALERCLDGDPRGAVRIIGGMLQQSPRHAEAWFVAGLASSALGDDDRAALAYHAAFHFARADSQLALATAAALGLAAYGDSTDERLHRLAEYYLQGSGSAKPPPKFPRVNPVVPWETALTDQEVGERLETIAQLPLPDWTEDPISRPAPKRPWRELDVDSLAALLCRFEVAFAKPDTIVIEEDSPGSNAFVIASGAVSIWRKTEDGSEQTLARLGNGDIFGEMALLTRTLRTANVTPNRVSVLLVASQSALDEVTESHPLVGEGLARHCRHRMLENLLAVSPVLKVVQPKEHAELLSCFEACSFETGEQLVTRDQEPKGLHVIALGRVSIASDDSTDSSGLPELGIGEVVGETALVLRRPADATVTALMPTVTLFLPREQFLKLVEEYPLVLRALYSSALKRTEGDHTPSRHRSRIARDVVLV